MQATLVRVLSLFVAFFCAQLHAAIEIPKAGDHVDLVLADGRVLTNVEVTIVDNESIWVWAEKTLSAIKKREIRACRLHVTATEVAQPAVVPPQPSALSKKPSPAAEREESVVPKQASQPSSDPDRSPERSMTGPTPTKGSIMVLLAFALLLTVVSIVLVARSTRELCAKVADYEKRYAPITDVEQIVKERRDELDQIGRAARERQLELGKLGAELEILKKTIASFDSEAELIACGHYKPQFDFGTSEHYKEAITIVREKQRALIKDERAAACGQAWLVNGSETEGRKATKRTLRLMLRAFNGECDAIIANVSWSNIDRMSERMGKAFVAINKLGESYHCSIREQYLQLRREELDLAYGYALKVQKEKDEQRAIREQLREEEKARREMDAAIRQSALDEERARAALEKARAEVAKSSGDKEASLNEKIQRLEQQLAEAHTNKERAMSRAEMTRSGHVYIISNIGSFGEAVFKIGMTRRLDPFERIDELGDASVPFEFDVHGMIYTEDAPTLESKLHARFDNKRVNLVNERKEFFNVTVDEIQKAVQELGAEVILTKLAEAREYRETQERRRVLSEPGTAALAG